MIASLFQAITLHEISILSLILSLDSFIPKVMVTEVVGLVWYFIWFSVLTFAWLQVYRNIWGIENYLPPTPPTSTSEFSQTLISVIKTSALYIGSYAAISFLTSGAERVWLNGGYAIDVVAVALSLLWIVMVNSNSDSSVWNPFHVGFLTSLLVLCVLKGLVAVGITALPVVGALTTESMIQLSYYPGAAAWVIGAYPPGFLEQSGSFEPAASRSKASSAPSQPQSTQGQESTTNSPQPRMQDGGRDDQQSEQSRNHRREETTPRQQPPSEHSTNGLEFDWQEPPDTTFEDVGGYETVKDELREDVISPYVNDSAGYERFQVTPDRGILFHGPPGTGKTLFARALAHELQRPYVELSQSQLTSKWINEGPDLIDQLFTEAQQLRGVVFIDEAESLLGSRDDGLSSNREDAKTTNTFLNKLSQDDQEFFVVLTTNRKDRMDDAVLRPGRVDKHVEIPVPDLDARYEILKTQLEDVPSDLDVETMREMARELDGASGADIEQVVADARRSAAKQNSSALRRHHFDLDILDA